MITSALIWVAMGLMTSLTFALPNYDPIPANLYDLITGLTELVYSFDYILPIGTIFNIILVGFYIQLMMIAFDILLFVLKQTRIFKV